MILQSRDRKILRKCYEQQFLLMEHVSQYFYQAKSMRESYRRVQEMEAAGLIRREEIPVLGGKKLIRLTKLGIAIALENNAVEVPQGKRLDLTTLSHDSMVTHVRLRLEHL